MHDSCLTQSETLHELNPYQKLVTSVVIVDQQRHNILQAARPYLPEVQILSAFHLDLLTTPPYDKAHIDRLLLSRLASTLLMSPSGTIERDWNGIIKTGREEAQAEPDRLDQIDTKQHVPDHEVMDATAKLEFDKQSEAEMRELWKDMEREQGKSIDFVAPKYEEYAQRPPEEAPTQEQNRRPDTKTPKPPLRLSGGNHYRPYPERGPRRR